MQSLLSKLNALELEALEIIRGKVKEHNGELAIWATSEIWAGNGDQLKEVFTENAFEFTADSQYDTNETVYLLGITDQSGLSFRSITEDGEEIVTNGNDMELVSLCAIADYIKDIK